MHVKQNSQYFTISFKVTQLPKKNIDQKLVMNRNKSVSFYTKYIFTVGHTNSQRSQYLIDVFKGFGSTKQEMIRLNIFQLMS